MIFEIILILIIFIIILIILYFIYINDPKIPFLINNMDGFATENEKIFLKNNNSRTNLNEEVMRDPSRSPFEDDYYYKNRSFQYAPLNELKMKSILENNADFPNQSIDEHKKNLSNTIEKKIKNNFELLIPKSQYLEYSFDDVFPFGRTYTPL
jgi:hypothetical protein